MSLADHIRARLILAAVAFPSLLVNSTIVAAGNITTSAGNIVASAGSISSSGNISTSAGNISASAGSISSSGNISTSAGNISASAGSISSSGNISTSAGKMFNARGGLSSDFTGTSLALASFNSTDIDLRTGTGTFAAPLIGGTSRLYIKASTGAVLVGTTTDDGVNKLQVAGTATFAGDVTLTSSGDLYARVLRSTISFLSTADSGTTGFQLRNRGAALEGIDFTNAANNVTWATLGSNGLVISSGSFAAMTAGTGRLYSTSTDGLLIFGRGSTNDFILGNSDGSSILSVAHGVVNTQFYGTVGIGSAPVTYVAAYIGSTLSGNGNQVGVQLVHTANSSATTAVYGVNIAMASAASAFTIPDVYGVRCQNFSKGATSAVTNYYALYVDDLTAGSTYNIGLVSAVSSGTNKWNVYASGTAPNHMAGELMLGTTTSGSSILTVNGYSTFNAAVTPTMNIQSTAAATAHVLQCWHQATTGDNKFINFYTEGGGGSLRGGIDFNRAGVAVRYNTTSDIRLKRDLGIYSSLRILKDTMIHKFQWLETGEEAVGVFAQEAFKVHPNAVSIGDQAWGVDYSKYVPNLIAGWQNHEQRISTLERSTA